jgi:hypothetical protein
MTEVKLLCHVGGPATILYSNAQQDTNTEVTHRITGVFGLFPSSGVLGNRNTTFRKLDLFSSSGEGREQTGPEIS